MKKYIFIVLFLFIIINPLVTSAQQTKILGHIRDSLTGEPIPFASIAFKNTNIGTTSDFSGNFSLQTHHDVDSLVFSCVGYQKMIIPVKKNSFQELDIKLASRAVNLSEVIIRYRGNPAERVLKKVIKNKETNNWRNNPSLEYEVYNKIQFDANNITEDFRNREVFKPFQFIFDYVDTSTINGKSYLPLFLSESISDFYYRKKPREEIEIIKATKTSGIKNESLSQFTGNMYQEINIYENHMMLFEKNFVSPIANFGLNFYKYYLTDSAFIDSTWCKKIMFKPRRKQELTFTGHFWVADSSFAIKEIDMRVNKDANLNYVNDMLIEQQFNKKDSLWLPAEDKITIDFNLIENNKKILGFFGTKTTSYKNYVINQPKTDEFYHSPTRIIITDSALDRSEEFWQSSRHDTLNREENNIYYMIDSIKNIPAFRTYVDIVKTVMLGYYIWGNFEIGPYIKTISYNDVEGYRFRLGGRTSNDFSTKLMLDAHVAYGTKDEKFKYGGGYIYMISKNPRRAFGNSYKYDIEQLGQSQNAFSEDHLIASFFRRNPLDKLSLVEEFKGYYDHEWFTGFSNTITLKHRQIYPAGKTRFEFLPQEESTRSYEKKSITTAEIEIGTRFAYDEKYLMGEFERVSLGTTYPVLELKYAHAVKGLWGSDYSYNRLQLSIKHWYNIGSFGWSKYILETGKIWGRLPYPLLKMHSGNETFIFDEYAFNTMNYYEFVSDNYATFYYTHHFDGFFLNHIPLMRRLKFREVVTFKTAIGSLEEKNQNYSMFPPSLSQLSKPYAEAGVGVENILKIFRVDAFWRLSYLDNHRIRKFGFLASLQFSF